MSKIILTSDGTIEGTVLKVDGVNVTQEDRITSIRSYISSTNEIYNENTDSWIVQPEVNFSYRTLNKDEKGKIEEKTINVFGGDSWEKDYYENTLKLKAIGEKDSVIPSIFLGGKEVDIKSNKEELADSILELSTLVSKEDLMKRTVDSLTDKLNDLK